MKRKHQVLLILLCAVFVWSYIGCYDRFTWFLEVLPVLVAIPILAVTYRRFPLTDLLYTFIAIHAIVLMIGGHYTYARVPPFDWIRDYFELSRNHYDKVGHFAQGFIPALITREVLLRTTALRKGRMLFFLVLCVCLAFSAVYPFVFNGSVGFMRASPNLKPVIFRPRAPSASPATGSRTVPSGSVCQ